MTFELVDIGSDGGLPKQWIPFKNQIDVIEIEPRQNNTLIYKDSRGVNFHLTKNPRLSSILKPNRIFIDNYPDSDRFNIVKTLKMRTKTIDELIDSVDFLKIDCQGVSYEVLLGAKHLLKDCSGVMVEVEFQEMYSGQHLFADVDKLLRDSGFRLFNMNQEFWCSGKRNNLGAKELIWADVLYLKESPHNFSKTNFIKKVYTSKPKFSISTTIWNIILFIYHLFKKSPYSNVEMI